MDFLEAMLVIDHYLTAATKQDVHVVPTGWHHESSPECWCRPRIDYVGLIAGRVWVHKAPA